MSTLSDAFAAMEKAKTIHPENYEEFIDQLKLSNIKAGLDAKKFDAIDDAFAWIKKALPWVEKRAESLRTFLILARAEKDEAYAELIADASEELAALDALLAEAKGDNHAEN